jgi:hypothetical protein
LFLIFDGPSSEIKSAEVEARYLKVKMAKEEAKSSLEQLKRIPYDDSDSRQKLV